MSEKWYTIEKNASGYTIWLNIQSIGNNMGGGGCLGLFTADTKKQCLEYCKEHKITITKI